MAQLTPPAGTEPESLADLVADCSSIRTPRPGRVAAPPPVRPAPPGPPAGISIPDSTAALLDGMPEYGD